ncbi:hypothetical protein [Dethiothermospora halolimnae]|uniref:hypothetical protein n=1 Tax=Dethiothermospora halolimnae TaxID=3114390 RepID=UPI003CCBBE90
MRKKFTFLLLGIVLLSLIIFINQFNQETYLKVSDVKLENQEDIDKYFSKFLNNTSFEIMEYSHLPSLENTLVNLKMMNRLGLIDEKNINRNNLKKLLQKEILELGNQNDDMGLYRKYDLLHSYQSYLDEFNIGESDLVLNLAGDINQDVDMVLEYMESHPEKIVTYLEILNKILYLNVEKNIEDNIKGEIEKITNINYDKYPPSEQRMIRFNLLKSFNYLGLDNNELEGECKKTLNNMIEKYKINGNISIKDIVILNKGVNIFSNDLGENKKLKEIVEEMKLMLIGRNDHQTFVKSKVYDLINTLDLWDSDLKEWVLNMPRDKGYIYPKPVSLIPTFRNMYLYLRVNQLNSMDFKRIEKNKMNYLEDIIKMYGSRTLSKQELYYGYKLKKYLKSERLDKIIEKTKDKYIGDINSLKITKKNIYENYMLFQILDNSRNKSKLKDKFYAYFNNGDLNCENPGEELFINMMKLNIDLLSGEDISHGDIKKYNKMITDYKGELEITILKMYLRAHENLNIKVNAGMVQIIKEKLNRYRVKNGYFIDGRFRSVSLYGTQQGLEIESLLILNDRRDDGD